MAKYKHIHRDSKGRACKIEYSNSPYPTTNDSSDGWGCFLIIVIMALISKCVGN